MDSALFSAAVSGWEDSRVAVASAAADGAIVAE
jgi:hypothetical protein